MITKFKIFENNSIDKWGMEKFEEDFSSCQTIAEMRSMLKKVFIGPMTDEDFRKNKSFLRVFFEMDSNMNLFKNDSGIAYYQDSITRWSDWPVLKEYGEKYIGLWDYRVSGKEFSKFIDNVKLPAKRTNLELDPYCEEDWEFENKIYENDSNGVDPYGEENWEDKGLENKRFRVASSRVWSRGSKNPDAKEIDYGFKLSVPQMQEDFYIDFHIFKARLYNVSPENWDDEMINTLSYSYTKEYPDNGTVRVGHECMGWGHEYIYVEDIDNMDLYTEFLFNQTKKHRDNRCFIFDIDTPINTVLEYCKDLYEKVKNYYQNTNRYKDVYMRMEITRQD